ncbi:MAG: DNA polymerase III subunit gamma/tau [Flavobacteriaceae bacterium]
MSEFVISALKYRPENFVDVAGQDSVTKTLENAIKQNQIPQAILFCGPRGVGKTTCARIFAKKINSIDIKQNFKNFSYNIFELDAASNNGVEDIRNLIDQVRIPPQVGKYKVYIIDEVHMLSGAAFNAFLKTLEEPPTYAIFILATTEKHKVIPTILSRCQIYDFKKITINDIKSYIEKIAKKENVKYEDEGLYLIAKKSDGALRDALSIFDRLVNYTQGNITKELAYDNLNVLDFEIYFKTFEYIINNDIYNCLLIFNSIIEKGFSEYDFIDGFGIHLRDLLVAKNKESEILLEQNESIKKKYIQQSELKNSKFIIDAISLVEEFSFKYKSSKNQRLLIEICLMKLCMLDPKKDDNGEDEKKKSIIDNSSKKLYNKSSINKIKTYNNDNKEDSKPKTSVVEFNDEKLKNKESEKIENPNNLVSGLSISSLKVKKSIEKEKKSRENVQDSKIKTEKFSLDNLLISWREFYQYLSKEGEKNLASILQIDNPTIVNGYEIHYTLSNNINKSELEKNKKRLVDFLKKKLNNKLIDLKIHVNKESEKKYVFTTKEKFDMLKKINPSIDKLRKEFKLGF